MGSARRKSDEFRAGKKTSDESSVGTATTASFPPSSRGELTVASVQTLPSEAIDSASKVAKNLKLSEAEEQELKKMEKRLREISKLEAKGIEHLDKLQLSKIAQREEIESSMIFRKLKAGYCRG